MALKFENLNVWQKALELTAHVDDVTKKFPKEELYVLTSQLKRAVDSIALNIAEGSTGQTNAEFKQFLGYAVRSGIETVACLHLGKRRGILAEDDFNCLYEEVTEILKMTHGLRRSLR